MPALTKGMLLSLWGKMGKEGTIRWPRSPPKNSRNVERRKCGEEEEEEDVEKGEEEDRLTSFLLLARGLFSAGYSGFSGYEVKSSVCCRFSVVSRLL